MDVLNAVSLQPGVIAKMRDYTHLHATSFTAEPPVKHGDYMQKQEDKAVSTDDVKINNPKRDLGELNAYVAEASKNRIAFSFDKQSGQQVISVVDKESGDVIKQYPTEAMLEIKKRIGQATGVLINRDA